MNENKKVFQKCIEKPMPKKGQREYAVGEAHAGHRVSDADIELMFKLREDYGFTYPQIVAKFDNYEPPLSTSTVRDILNGRNRARRG